MSDPSFAAGQILLAEDIQDLGEYGTYTPVFTTDGAGADPTLGAGGSVSGEWHRNGRLFTVLNTVIFGSSGVAAGSGLYVLTTPFTVASSWVDADVGGVHLRDASVPDTELRHVIAYTATTIAMVDRDGSGVTNSAPWVWAADDSFRLTYTVLIA